VAHEGIPFGKYRLVKRLARGGMAEVFLAHQSGPDGFRRRVAVKRILPHLADSAEFVGMFLDEARLAAALSHPNIVHVYDFGKVDDYYFIAMEFVDGVDAGQVTKLSAREPVAPEIVARVVADAAAGLHHAHALADGVGRPFGIVHRDVSPQNLLISFDGVVKVVDFGIAKAAHQAERTRPGVVKGKFAYMSPEQVVGKSLDGRSDVFSLGVVAWEMLAGRYIVSREDPAEAMRLIRDGKLPRIESVRRDVPPALAAAIARAMAKEARERPTAADFALELETYLKGAVAVANALAVAEWARSRFPRDATGPLPVVPGGTQGTVAGTMAGTMAATAATPGPGGTQAATSMEPRRPETAPPTKPDDLRDLLPGSAGGPPPAQASLTALAPPPPRRRGLPIAIGFTAMLAVAGGLWAAGVLGGDEASSATAARPAPSAAPSVTPFAEPPPAPRADAGAAGTTVPLPPEAPALAALEIVTDPAGARVILDDVPVDTPTPTQLMDLAPGEHELEIGLAGYKAVTRKVIVAAGDRRTLELTLTPEPGTPAPTRPPSNAREERPRARPSSGWLTVRTLPYSDVYLGGRKLGTTPFANIELPAGTHTLVFKNPDKGVRKRKVVIRPGATTKLSFEL
jgi:serine/threonine-protein kinase